jgi:hypothetical protein
MSEQRTVDREVDAQGHCSRCGGLHFGSYICPMPDEQIKETNMHDEYSVAVEMPRYKSHKIVHALQIKDVTGCTITPVEEGYAPFEVEPEMYLCYTPTASDYYVVYADGYKSFSPRKAFEEGYTRV